MLELSLENFIFHKRNDLIQFHGNMLHAHFTIITPTAKCSTFKPSLCLLFILSVQTYRDFFFGSFLLSIYIFHFIKIKTIEKKTLWAMKNAISCECWNAFYFSLCILHILHILYTSHDTISIHKVSTMPFICFWIFELTCLMCWSESERVRWNETKRNVNQMKI